ncbi:MAG: 4-hydroxy-tetrahydrodipicolinate reductase [Chloroflexi bacterium]|nr:4-hydroxy-tetrahydrodipicolinate reductase [Chloroflexota bacterium]MQC16667.1 4-hydroxy-tetrahydrodipicolinate reductase [Chloroflexota bacterium]
MIQVAVSGTGQMSRLVIETVAAQDDMQLAGVLAPRGGGPEYRLPDGSVLGVYTTPEDLFAATAPDVIVDFTNAAFMPRLVEAATVAGVRLVAGTSGVTDGTIEAWRAACASRGLGGVYAANFAIGAVLLMHMTTIAAKFFDSAEVIELHHDRKVDSPSGTALATTRMMREARGSDFVANTPDVEHIEGARGARTGGIPIHSVRLPGFVASQEVIFGGQGQTLSLRHDSTGRDSFMPGVVLAVREVMQRSELVVGLDALVGLR